MEMRRKDRMLNEDQTLDILNRSEYGILSTIGVDNVPYGVPMNFVYEDGVIYFHCAKAVGYKVSNIIHNSNACFTVINDVCLQPKTFSTKYSSAIVFGKVSIVEDEDEKKKGIEQAEYLYKKLYYDNRLDNMKRAFENEDYRRQLMKEYGLQVEPYSFFK